jgi:hypothetical protein
MYSLVIARPSSRRPTGRSRAEWPRRSAPCGPAAAEDEVGLLLHGERVAAGEAVSIVRFAHSSASGEAAAIARRDLVDGGGKSSTLTTVHEADARSLLRVHDAAE